MFGLTKAVVIADDAADLWVMLFMGKEDLWVLPINPLYVSKDGDERIYVSKDGDERIYVSKDGDERNQCSRWAMRRTRRTCAPPRSIWTTACPRGCARRWRARQAFFARDFGNATVRHDCGSGKRTIAMK